MRARENARIARALYDRFNLRDFESGVLLVSPSAQWICMPGHRQFQGFGGYRKMVGTWIDACPDLCLDIVNLIATNEWVATEYVGTGTHAGCWRGPVRSVPPTGRVIRIAFCEVLRLDGRRILASRLYFDQEELYDQMTTKFDRGV